MKDDWVRMVRHYAARDLAFIVGGASLLLCLGFCFPDVRHSLFGSDISGAEYLLLAGVAYVLGYFTQEVLSILFPKEATSSTDIEPSKYLKWAYKRWMHRELDLTKTPNYDQDNATIYINTRKSERNQAEYERLTGHLIMCMAIGSCWMIVGLILVLRFMFVRDWQVFLFGCVVFLIGYFLLFLGRLKALHIRKFRHDLIKAPKFVVRSLRESQQTVSEQ